MREYLKNVAIACKGNYKAMYMAIKNREPVCSFETSDSYVCIGEAAYPACFYELACPPWVVFYEGNLSLLKTKSVGVIGSRKPETYSLDMTREAVLRLKPQATIVSGFAYGIDICAHKNSLDFSTIAVLGCGVDVCYPKEHAAIFEYMKRYQLVISEFPWGVRPQKHHFPFRNRLIAALSDPLYVMSASLKSGTMHTVEVALDLNRHVVCLPHRLHDKNGEGCNRLIQDGAGILTNLEDLANI